MPFLAFGALMAALSYLLGGFAGLAQAVIYVAATAPGWPLGWAAFGRRHPAGWVAGALMGYALTCLTFALVIRAGAASPVGFLAAWAALCGLTWGVAGRRPDPLVPLAGWTRRDTAALLAVALLVPLLTVPVFRNVGAVDAAGVRHYRAYFTADFVWHEALAAELGRFEVPPRNPYLASEPLHYYWSYFLVPAVSAALLRPGAPYGPEPILLVNAMWAGLGLVAMLFIATWAMVPRAWAAAAAVTIAVVAASAEGAWILWGLFNTGGSVATVTDLNIDAITMWRLRGLTVDGLPRSLWYVPQHAGACAMGLIALVIGARAPARMMLGETATAGLALALAITFSPFPGGVIAVVYGLGVIAVRLGSGLRDLVRTTLLQGVAAAIAAAGIAWVVANGMIEGAGGAVQFGLLGNARRAPLQTILLALGPLLLPGLAGLLFVRGARQLRAAAAGLLVALPAFFFVSVAHDPVWAGWRAGQIMLVTLPPLVAATFAWIADRADGRENAVAAFLALLAVGAPTTVIDAYNAQDISNDRMGPGFRWTVTLDPDQQAALSWIRTSTPPDAVVQADPIVRGRDTWTLVPTFAQRRSAAGLPISLLFTQAYQDRSDAVHFVFGSEDPARAWQAARYLGIDYLYLDDTERRALPPAATAKFDAAPERFRRVFASGRAAVYAVARR
jgi:hypothetical protein